MLTIGKLAAGPSVGRYYLEQVASGREDYYAGGGEAPGAWIGTGSKALGLKGEVAKELGRILGRVGVGHPYRQPGSQHGDEGGHAGGRPRRAATAR